MSLDHYLTTPPADEQNALTPEEPEGCADCGQAVCDCDERCPGCMHKFTSKADADFGMCVPCRIDLAESLRDEVA